MSNLDYVSDAKLVFESIPHYKNGNYVTEFFTLNKYPIDIQEIVVPHQFIHHYKNFWGADVTVVKHPKYDSPQSVGKNLPIIKRVYEYITDEFQSLEDINNKLHKDGLNIQNDIDLKTVYYHLLVENKVQRNKNWEVRRI